MLRTRRLSDRIKRPHGASQPSTRSVTVSREEGVRLLDRQARKYLGVSGAEFRRQYRDGTIKDSDGPDVVRVAALIPFADD